MEEFIFELSNGIRVIFKPTTGNVAHCGFIINTGSRDETLIENGMAHFIEHAIFKGTIKRKTHHILNRIDSVGGEINAFTTKENTNMLLLLLNILKELLIYLPILFLTLLSPTKN